MRIVYGLRAGKAPEAQFICQQLYTADLYGQKGGGVYTASQQRNYGIWGVCSDDIIGLVKERIQEADRENGRLFDGFPRTIPQAQAMVDEGISIDHVLEIAVADEEIIQRLSGRRVHPGSGRVYHVVFNPPEAGLMTD